MAAPPSYPGPGGSIPAPPPEPEQVYQPLSLLAVVGFALAGLYAIFFGLAALASLVFWTPLLMSSATLLLPAAGVIVSLLAWLQIRRSEGALAGKTLAGWGMFLGGFFALIYTAYAAGSYAALRQQSAEFTREWLAKLSRKELDRAFLLSLEPMRRPPDGPDLRRELELRFNADGDSFSGKGRYSLFQESELARLLSHAGDALQVEPRGVLSWEYVEGGYRVKQSYHIRTPETEGDVIVTARGTESRGSEGRQWTILLDETGLKPGVQPTSLGEKLTRLRDSAGRFIPTWFRKLGFDQMDEVFLDTLGAPQRRQAETSLLVQRSLALVAANLAPDCSERPLDEEQERLLYQPGYAAFRDGALVVAPTDKFWAPERLKNEIPIEVKRLFRGPGTELSEKLRQPGGAPVAWVREGDRLRLSYPMQVAMQPRFVAEANLILETDAKYLESDPQAAPWRVASVELIRGKTPSAQRMP